MLAAAPIFGQQPQTVPGYQTPRSGDPVNNISTDVSKLVKSVDGLTKNWKDFFAAFATNQGLQLTERQKKILLALEVLNRGEQRLGNLQKMRMESSEKLSALRLQLAKITDDVLPETVDRFVALRGTTDAEALRNIRRQALQKERNEVTLLIDQSQRDLDTTNEELRQTDLFLKNLRNRVFPEIEKELADL